jgi:excisionase family DNA binding protein
MSGMVLELLGSIGLATPINRRIGDQVVPMPERVILRDDDRSAFGIPELARRYDVSPGFWRLEVSRGHLKALRLGRRLLVTKEELDRYLKERQA